MFYLKKDDASVNEHVEVRMQRDQKGAKRSKNEPKGSPKAAKGEQQRVTSVPKWDPNASQNESFENVPKQ